MLPSNVLAIDDPLTMREAEVCRIILENPKEPYKILASRLEISESTFSIYVSNVFKKLNVHSKNELYARFVTLGSTPEDIILNRVIKGIESLEQEVLNLRLILKGLIDSRNKDANKISQAV